MKSIRFTPVSLVLFFAVIFSFSGCSRDCTEFRTYIKYIPLEKTITEQRNSTNDLFVGKVCFHNVEIQMERILKRSSLLTEMIDRKEIGLIGAVYNLASGEVEFDHNHTYI